MPISRRATLAALAGGALAPGLLPGRALAAAGQTLVGVIEEDPPLINPALSSLISSFVAGAPVYSALTRMDAHGKVTGDLAERFEIAPDGLAYTFHLRKGITWHDGAPFSSEDVVFSLREINAKLHPYRGVMRAIDRFEAPDADTVVLRLKTPIAALINTLHNFSGCILPKHLWAGTDYLGNPHNRQPVGTGPYKLASYASGDRITYTRNDAYFIAGEPAFEQVVLRIIPDPSSRVAAFEHGDVDMMYASALPPTQVARLKRMRGVEMVFNTVSAAGYIGYINMRNAPYSDVRVRRALAHAIDRSFIRNAVFPGLSANMVGPLPPDSPLYDASLADYEFDPHRAKALLDEAGFKPGADGTRFDFRYLFAVTDLVAQRMGDIIAQNLAAVGIRTVLTPLERGTWISRSFTDYAFDMTVGSFALGPDPDVAVERFYNSANILPGPFVNCSPYSNPAVDALFEEQRIQIDPVRRKAVYARIQALIWADLPVFPICAYDLPGAVHTDVATGVFDSDSSNRDDFSAARPAKA